jgi:hypothetical protein
MSIRRSVNIAIVAVIATLGLVLTFITASISAQETGDEEATPATTSEEAETTKEPVEATTDTEETESTETYNYVAQPGDSYSLMARKAIQTYGINNSVNLSGAQILYAETNLTQLAGSPVLVLGQNVEITESVVSEWVEKSQDLSEEQQAAWQVYVPFANFNTNSIGQSQE